MTDWRIKGGQALKDVADFLLPPRCPTCRARVSDHGHLCGSCWAGLSPIAPPFCGHCGLPFDHGAEEDETLVCGACMQHLPAFDWARAAVLYDGLGKKLVLALKHGGEGAVVPLLARMMASRLVSAPKVDLVIPIPLHPKRLFRRRFNQSQLLGTALAAQLGVPADAFALVRRKATPSQGGLGRAARRRNVAGAFRVAEGAELQLKGKRILLVDDVLTTGATGSAAAVALKRAGAGDVGLVAFARVPQAFS